MIIVEDVMTSGKALREILPKLKAAANVEIAGMVISVDRTALSVVFNFLPVKTVIEVNSVVGIKRGSRRNRKRNAFTGMAVDLEKRRPVIANNTGGVSGAGIKPIAVRMVYEASHDVYFNISPKMVAPNICRK